MLHIPRLWPSKVFRPPMGGVEIVQRHHKTEHQHSIAASTLETIEIKKVRLCFPHSPYPSSSFIGVWLPWHTSYTAPSFRNATEYSGGGWSARASDYHLHLPQCLALDKKVSSLVYFSP